jgi:hypothetical protein
MLSEEPFSCLVITPDKDGKSKDLSLIHAGRALFNTPTLLGGQAAKAGLSCASCHTEGRNNPHFMLSGVSDRPGTADVTSSFFSKTSGNAKFDPVPIPDLTAPGKVSRDAKTGKLEPFIRTLIVDEFAGAEPGPDAIAALAAYVRALRDCNRFDDESPVSVDIITQVEMIESAIRGHPEMAKRGDFKSAQLLIAAMRHQLQLIDERFASTQFARERADILSASRKLQQIGQIQDLGAQGAALKSWKIDLNKDLLRRLDRKQAKSLYNPSLLAKHFPPNGKAPSKR